MDIVWNAQVLQNQFFSLHYWDPHNEGKKCFWRTWAFQTICKANKYIMIYIAYLDTAREEKIRPNLMEEYVYTLDVLITAPHWCKVDQSEDLSCDLGTKVYAKEIYKEILKIKGEEHVKLFLTDVPRGLCDVNRDDVCITQSEMRDALKEEIERQKTMRGSKFVLFDIHSFGQYESEESYFGLPPSVTPDVVLLTFPHETVTGILVKRLRANELKSEVVYASAENDIILEATRAGGKAVLVEIHVPRGAKMNPRIVQSIRETVETLEKM
jgi:hypothetical protein